MIYSSGQRGLPAAPALNLAGRLVNAFPGASILIDRLPVYYKQRE